MRPLSGVVAVERLERDKMVIRGQHTLDIREFDLDVPPLLALEDLTPTSRLRCNSRPGHQ